LGGIPGGTLPDESAWEGEPVEDNPVQHLDDTDRTKIQGTFGPYASVCESSEGFGGGAHGFDSNSCRVVTPPGNQNLGLDFLGPDALAALNKAVHEESEQRKKELAGDDSPLPIGDLPETSDLASASLWLGFDEEEGFDLTLHDTIACCSWV